MGAEEDERLSAALAALQVVSWQASLFWSSQVDAGPLLMAVLSSHTGPRRRMISLLPSAGRRSA